MGKTAGRARPATSTANLPSALETVQALQDAVRALPPRDRAALAAAGRRCRALAAERLGLAGAWEPRAASAAAMAAGLPPWQEIEALGDAWLALNAWVRGPLHAQVAAAAAAMFPTDRAVLRAAANQDAPFENLAATTRARRAFFKLLHARAVRATPAGLALRAYMTVGESRQGPERSDPYLAGLDVAAAHYGADLGLHSTHVGLHASATAGAYRVAYVFDLDFTRASEVLLDSVADDLDRHEAAVKVADFRLEHPPGRAVLRGHFGRFTEEDFFYTFPTFEFSHEWGGDASGGFGNLVGYRRVKAAAGSLVCFAHAFQSAFRSRARLPLHAPRPNDPSGRFLVPPASWLLAAFPNLFVKNWMEM